MSTETEIKFIKELIDALLISENEYFLVALKIKPVNNIKVFIDGDNGITIEKCVQFNRSLYKKVEERNLYPSGDFSLEVSSPGIDEPLQLYRQYKKNIGRLVEVAFKDGTLQNGKLLNVLEEDIIIEQTTGKNKKLITQQTIIPFEKIKTITVQIQF